MTAASGSMQRHKPTAGPSRISAKARCLATSFTRGAAKEEIESAQY